MRSRSRNSHRKSKSSRRSSRVCPSNSCCVRSEQEQNLCYRCTRESCNSKCTCCCRPLKCKPSNVCNLKCQDKNTGVAKPLNVHLKLQLLNDRNQNKKSECLCAKYFQMLNACYGRPPFCQNLSGQADGEEQQMRENPSFLKSMNKKYSFFNCRKPNHNIEQTYLRPSSSQQHRPAQVQELIRHIDSVTQTDEKLPCTCEDYVEKLLSTDKTHKMQTETSNQHDVTMCHINNTLNEITNTLQSMQIELNKRQELKSEETENYNFTTTKTSRRPTIVSYFTKCAPPPPLLTLSKLSFFRNPSPTFPIFPSQKTAKANSSCEEILKLFNFDGRNSRSYDFNMNHCVPRQDISSNNKSHVYTKEATFQANDDHDML